ncbi:Lrp/AsnC family transcriptional regulator [Candidatus Bathyarchaeota archaeon]|nr:Lrp/AsnC family transcriptional regulator [Candidatus Bathyarchaeota archaeon]
MARSNIIEAYSLVVVEHGAGEAVLNDLLKLKGVVEASPVYGEFDIHCKISVSSMDELGEVLGKIRKLKIVRTETLIARTKYKRKSGLTNNHHRKMGHKRARH